jgi:hypothetical protein
VTAPLADLLRALAAAEESEAEMAAEVATARERLLWCEAQLDQRRMKLDKLWASLRDTAGERFMPALRCPLPFPRRRAIGSGALGRMLETPMPTEARE